MAWVTIEVEYVCQFCGDVHIDNPNKLIREIGTDVSKCRDVRCCSQCDACFGVFDGMDIAKISIPVRDNFGASIF